MIVCSNENDIFAFGRNLQIIKLEIQPNYRSGMIDWLENNLTNQFMLKYRTTGKYFTKTLYEDAIELKIEGYDSTFFLFEPCDSKRQTQGIRYLGNNNSADLLQIRLMM